MEVNIKNAFPLAVKLSLTPCHFYYKQFKDQIEFQYTKGITFVLEHPSIGSALLIGTIAVFYIPALCSAILFAGVFCLIFSIILMEGFVILTSVLLFTVGLLLTILFSIFLLFSADTQ